MVPPPNRARSNPRPPTDPPLPPPVATSITASVAEGDDAAASKALVEEGRRGKQKEIVAIGVTGASEKNKKEEEEKKEEGKDSERRGRSTSKDSLTIDRRKPKKETALDAAARERIWATRSGDSQRLKNTLRDLHRFLVALPFPLIKVTPTILARAICRVLASQRLMPTNIAFDVALLFWRLIINIFFRSIQPRGSWRIPRPNEGPVIFVAAPHHNQFLDPLLLASEVRRGSGRRVAFLIAEKSIKRQFIGAAAKLMQSIPVARAADSAKAGKGTVSVHPSGDKLLLQGHSSQFTKQLVVRGQILLPKATGYATAEVEEIISDTEVRIKKEFKDERAIEALKGKLPEGPMDKKEGGKEPGMEGCKYQCLPYVDQTQMYASVYERLAEGGSLGIFPEGGSHDRTDLLPLKAGVVIMALGAMSANPGLNVRIVPVGLSYFHPHKFRSRAVVEFGAPIDVPRELVGLFEQGGEGKRKAVGEAMDLVFDGLKSVTVRAPDYETLMLIQAARRLYTPPGAHPSLSQVVELNRRFILGYLEFKDDPRVAAIKDDVLRYNKMLVYAGLRDHQVERATRAGWRSLGLLAYRLGLLGMWGTVALPGALLNAPVIILAKIISRKKAKEALAASQVKLKGRDVLATWKVLVSLGFTPILYCFYAGVATYLAHRQKLATKHQLFMPLYTLSILPPIAYSTLKFSEVGFDIYKSLPPLFVSLMPGNYKVIIELQQTRAKISSEIHTLIDELAPKIWDDFESRKIVTSPTASAPPVQTPTGEESIIWRQKSHDKKLDTKSPLAHPLAWADERLFGWGTSTRRGSSTTRALSADEFAAERRSSSAGEGIVDNASKEEPDGPGKEGKEGDEEEEDSSEDGVEEEEEEGDYEAIFRMLSPARMLGLGDEPSTPKSPRSPGAGGGSSGRRSRSQSRSRSGSQNETFAEKRNRSNSDLKALSSSSSNNNTRAGGPEPLSPTVRTTALADQNGSSARERGGARQRTASLSENISTDSFKSKAPKVHEEAFGKATKVLEKAEQQVNGSSEQQAPRVEEMKSAAPTPLPGSPAVRPKS